MDVAVTFLQFRFFGKIAHGEQKAVACSCDSLYGEKPRSSELYKQKMVR
jgi:hypothetical protein